MLKESTYLQRKIFRTPWHIDVASWHCGLHKTNEGASTWSVRLRLITEKRIIHQQEERLKIILKNAPWASLLPEKQTWSAIGLQRQLIAMLDAETETERDRSLHGSRDAMQQHVQDIFRKLRSWISNNCKRHSTFSASTVGIADAQFSRELLSWSSNKFLAFFSFHIQCLHRRSAGSLSLSLTTFSHDNARLAHVFVSYAHIIPSFLSHSMP